MRKSRTLDPGGAGPRSRNRVRVVAAHQRDWSAVRFRPARPDLLSAAPGPFSDPVARSEGPGKPPPNGRRTAPAAPPRTSYVPPGPRADGRLSDRRTGDRGGCAGALGGVASGASRRPCESEVRAPMHASVGNLPAELSSL